MIQVPSALQRFKWQPSAPSPDSVFNANLVRHHHPDPRPTYYAAYPPSWPRHCLLLALARASSGACKARPLASPRPGIHPQTFHSSRLRPHSSTLYHPATFHRQTAISPRLSRPSSPRKPARLLARLSSPVPSTHSHHPRRLPAYALILVPLRPAPNGTFTERPSSTPSISRKIIYGNHDQDISLRNHRHHDEL